MKNLKIIIGSILCFISFATVIGVIPMFNKIFQRSWTEPNPFLAAYWSDIFVALFSGLLGLGMLFGGLALFKSAGANKTLKVMKYVFAVILTIAALPLLQVFDRPIANLRKRPIGADIAIGVFALLELLGAVILVISALKQRRQKIKADAS